GVGYSCRCPAHDDKSPSLSIRDKNGRILLKCYAGCTNQSIVAKLGLSMRDLFGDVYDKRRGRPRKALTIVAEHSYRDKDGKLLFQVCRMDPKDFAQRRPDPSSLGQWIYNLKGIRQIPFRLPELIAAVRGGETVFVAEGEKDVETLTRHGFAATCNAGG